jgi:hypothetical protein
MVFALYTDEMGYTGKVSAPDRETAVRFLTERGYEPETYVLRELYEE